MPGLPCKICGARSNFICTIPNGMGRVSAIHIYRCLDCGLVFVGNALTDDEIGEAYSLIDSATYYSEIQRENAAKCRSASRHVKDLTQGDRKKKILDIGCGNGQFLEELLHDGLGALFGHEIPGADLSRLERLGVTLYRDMDWSSVPSHEFDIITLLDVAEHVPRPVDLFSQCFRMLRPGGHLYFHTPVVTRFDRLMQILAPLPLVGKVGRVWQQGRTNIFHLQNYTDAALRIALSTAGFADCQVEKRNELSWPVQRYVQVHLCENHGMPAALAPVVTAFLWPLLATGQLNSNKGIVTALRPPDPVETA
jgi:SAM-dependent methyltransferase